MSYWPIGAVLVGPVGTVLPIDDVKETVFGKRGRFRVLVRRGTADRDRIGEVQKINLTLSFLILSSGEYRCPS